MTNIYSELAGLSPEEQDKKMIEYYLNKYIPPRYKDCSKQELPPSIKEKINQAFEEKKGIFLTGQAGTGKTYIMYCILKELIKTREEDFTFIDMPWLSILLKSYVKKDTDPVDNIKEYTSPKYLFLDDLGVEKMTDFLFESFYTIIDIRYCHLKPCFISSNYSLKEISENINDRIASRIAEMCIIIKLEGEDKRIK